MELIATSIDKIAAGIVAGMILEAAYRGTETNAAEIAATVAADPNGETANYFRRAAADSLDWVAAFRADPELLNTFGGAA